MAKLFSLVVGALSLLVGATHVMAGPVQATGKPQRIVSLNMCTDQYLLALADRKQIAGLTRFAADPHMSAAAAQARNLRLLGSSAEEILQIQPDLMMGMPAQTHPIMIALRSQNYPKLNVSSVDTLDGIYAQLRLVGQAIGQPDRANTMITSMQAKLVSIGAPGKGRVAAYYQRRGYLTGAGTLMDDMMQRVGLRNLASELGRPSLSQLSIEELVAAQPDFLILEADIDGVQDQGTEMLNHPALRHIPRLKVPHAWTVCGGPSYVKAAHTLAQQIHLYDKAKAKR